VRHPQRHAADERAAWQHAQCRRLKHDPTVIDDLIAKAGKLSRRASFSQPARDTAYSVWIDFKNHSHKMDYPGFLAEQWPIGAGVTEAACKSLVKQRLCASGMRRKTTGVRVVVSLRELTHTVGRWTQFRDKIDQLEAKCFGYEHYPEASTLEVIKIAIELGHLSGAIMLLSGYIPEDYDHRIP
jgi:hypothetical protein